MRHEWGSVTLTGKEQVRGATLHRAEWASKSGKMVCVIVPKAPNCGRRHYAGGDLGKGVAYY